MALIAVLVFNPLLYQEIYSEIIYWRLFWMFPTGLLIALTAVKLVRNSQGKSGKGIVLLMICALLVVKGTNIYMERGFGKAENSHKVPAYVKEICDVILEREEKPKCIFPETLFHDVRQYSGEILMAYGRDILGYIIPNWGAERLIYLELESAEPNYSWILQCAGENDCPFVVTYESKGIEEELLVLYEYVEVAYNRTYKIYYNSQRTE